MDLNTKRDRDIQSEMDERGALLADKLSEIIHPKHIKEIASLLKFGLIENLHESNKICDEVGLSLCDFFAYENDQKSFIKFFLEDLEKKEDQMAEDFFESEDIYAT